MHSNGSCDEFMRECVVRDRGITDSLQVGDMFSHMEIYFFLLSITFNITWNTFQSLGYSDHFQCQNCFITGFVAYICTRLISSSAVFKLIESTFIGTFIIPASTAVIFEFRLSSSPEKQTKIFQKLTILIICDNFSYPLGFGMIWILSIFSFSEIAYRYSQQVNRHSH